MIGVREGATHPFPLNEWQHVALVADGKFARLYRQGREVAALKYKGLKRDLQTQSLSIGAMTSGPDDAPDPVRPCFWSGQIDELAIFNEALTPDQIKQIAAFPPQ